MHKSIAIFLLTLSTACHSWAQSEKPVSMVFNWGMSAGVNHYEEPGLMQLTGPELGTHARVTHWDTMPNAQLEGDVLLGRQKYTIAGSGSRNGVTNLETRWRALVPLFGAAPTESGLWAGLALHTMWNDLRGTTTFQGTTYAGYQRIAAQLWLPLRWTSGDLWEVDTGLLIYGRHTSKLAEVNSSYQDIVNTQRSGQYAQVTLKMNLANGEAIRPFVRYTHLADSNKVTMDSKTWLEPASNRWQVGVVWEFSAR
jgi:hypothetical protein